MWEAAWERSPILQKRQQYQRRAADAVSAQLSLERQLARTVPSVRAVQIGNNRGEIPAIVAHRETELLDANPQQSSADVGDSCSL
jgi:hypothetical protein